MWLEDFQKSLVIFEYVKKGVKFKNMYCSQECNFRNYTGNYCRLFSDVLYYSNSTLGQIDRSELCIKLFGDEKDDKNK